MFLQANAAVLARQQDMHMMLLLQMHSQLSTKDGYKNTLD